MTPTGSHPVDTPFYRTVSTKPEVAGSQNSPQLDLGRKPTASQPSSDPVLKFKLSAAPLRGSNLFLRMQT